MKQIGNAVETTAACQSSSLMTRSDAGVGAHGGAVLGEGEGEGDERWRVRKAMPCSETVDRSRSWADMAIGGLRGHGHGQARRGR